MSCHQVDGHVQGTDKRLFYGTDNVGPIPDEHQEIRTRNLSLSDVDLEGRVRWFWPSRVHILF